MAGYSGTPLAKKLGIKPGNAVLLVGAPDGFEGLLELPPEAKLTRRTGKGPYDVLLLFTKERAVFERELARLRELMTPGCGLWICWPKKASKVPTDMTEDVVREVALPTGLVDNKVCAIDEVWSGLRLVIRKELR
ncbi:MAG: DUF3052 domain-containing protein [Planctomycetes bacterium]|nr:DUF3052 domain-containing protein [Planctomycetota bacterium]